MLKWGGSLPAPAPSQAGAEHAAGASIEVSSDDWPRVRVSYTGAVHPALLRESLKDFAAIATRAEQEGVRVTWLVHMDGFRPAHVTAAMRRETADMLKGLMPQVSAITAAEARVASSSRVRGVMTAMTWLLPQPWPVAVFDFEDDAIAWLVERSTVMRRPA